MMRAAAAVALLLTVLGAHAADRDLVILYDNGQTRPLAPYFAPFETAAPDASPAHTETAPGKVDLTALLPIRTPELTPGAVRSRPWPRAVAPAPARPVFLIGADTRSRAWLVQHRDELADRGAVGLIVQADTVGDLGALAELGRGIPMTPVSGSDLARLLDLQHIPVLISRRGIQQ